jgi:hypothetical protein
MKSSRILSLLALALVLVAAPAFAATSQTVHMTSFVTATVGTSSATVQFTGTAVNQLTGLTVVFLNKDLVSTGSSPLGSTTVTLNSQHASTGTLASSSFPTVHTQNFFLQIQSQNLGTMVSDSPIILHATIHGCPPTATYTMTGAPVPFYHLGDPTKQTVMTVQNVVSNVTP